jgi:pimeloyl-ACP methyl ester carboxylesterase
LPSPGSSCWSLTSEDGSSNIRKVVSNEGICRASRSRGTRFHTTDGAGEILSTRPIADQDVRRTIREASQPGIKWAVPRYFQSATIKKEWIDRRLNLIQTWRCPILVLQGYEDPFQPYEYFEDIEQHIPNSTLAFVNAGRFPPLENPDETTEKIAAFLAE